MLLLLPERIFSFASAPFSRFSLELFCLKMPVYPGASDIFFSKALILKSPPLRGLK